MRDEVHEKAKRVGDELAGQGKLTQASFESWIILCYNDFELEPNQREQLETAFYSGVKFAISSIEGAKSQGGKLFEDKVFYMIRDEIAVWFANYFKKYSQIDQD